MASDSECLAADGVKPVYARACNDNSCPTWKIGEWSAVSFKFNYRTNYLNFLRNV